MRLPFIVHDKLGPEASERWRKQFVNTRRTAFESIWRRTQEQRTAEKSGWHLPNDSRRRILHYYDQYDVVPGASGYALILKAPYLWLSIASPTPEHQDYWSAAENALRAGSWKPVSTSRGQQTHSRGDLVVHLRSLTSYRRDKASCRFFPMSYRHLDVTMTSTRTSTTNSLRSQPWDVLDTGHRNVAALGSPTVLTDVCQLQDYLPFQVELGCGPSIEAQIPPLHSLHRLYSVLDSNGNFVLSPDQDSLLPSLLSNPEGFFTKAAIPYARSITANETLFFKLLRDLADHELLVGDVITNNFDGLSSLIGLNEHYVRRYKESKIIPDIQFHPNARALAVIGSHADRRLVHAAARKKRLKVIHIDPEGFCENGTFHTYPLESPQDGDLILRRTAHEFAREFYSILSHLLV